MWGRVAAWSIAALLAVLPACSVIELAIPVTAELSIEALAISRDQFTHDMTAKEALTLPANDPDLRDLVPYDQQTPPKLAAFDPTATDAAEPHAAEPHAAEPFGVATTRVENGDVNAKWATVKARIAAENKILAQCRGGRGPCPEAAKNFLAIIAQGRAATGRIRIGVINRAINLAIEPMSDMAQWGVIDRWSPPLETFTTGHGDCEDYAIAKYVALQAAGVAARDVKLVIVRNTAAKEDHAVVAVRVDGDWIMLDNRWLTLVADNAMRQIAPLFVLDGDGVRKFAPPTLSGTRQSPAPAPAAL